MIVLWLLLSLMLMPAVWLVCRPLWRARLERAPVDEPVHTAENVAAYRRRLARLDAARQRDALDAERYAEERLALERGLLDDTGERAPPRWRSPLSGRWLVPVLAVALVAGSLGLYRQQGAVGDLALYTAIQSVRNTPGATPAELVARLEAQAERQPDNPKVWLTLAPLYRDAGRLDKAIDSLRRAIALTGRRPALLARLAQLEFFAAGRTLTDEVQSLIDETLSRDPRQPIVLGLLGVAAFDGQHYDRAIDYWRRAIAGYDDDAAVAALKRGIAIARQRQGEPGKAREGSAASLRVRVSLADSLRERVGPDDSVFVVARDIDGKLPPLAVERLRVADLPHTVTLDDADAMTPRARLSAVERVRLVVRVSKQGQAAPRPGDLVGRLGPVTLADDTPEQALRIDRVVE
ncbi:MAG: hypothetical protein AWU55_1041 [Halomonadaceae bacterium T82-2]|nr:MAG: hypothetical protein AWU55_1041 [Halomonadaceae bacterium T82-2]